MIKQRNLNKIFNNNTDPSFNSCADIYIAHNIDKFIYYDNLIDVGLDSNNNPCYIETELTKKDRFCFNNKTYFFSYELNLPFEVLFSPLQNFITIVSSYINEGFVLRMSDKENYTVIMFDAYNEHNNKLIGKKYCKFKDTEFLSICFENFKEFIFDNSLLEKMNFIKRKERNSNISLLRIKIQLESYILHNRDKNENIGINIFKKLNYNNKNNRIFFLEHKLLMINRINHLINHKGMLLNDDIDNTFRKYTETINKLSYGGFSYDVVLKILNLEEHILKYISKYYKEHD